MHGSVQPFARLLVSTAVPVVLITGCSSGSHTAKHGQTGPAPTSTGSSTAPSARMRYTKLPDPCTSISQGTLKQMVPSAKDAGGKPATATDPSNHGGCSWNGLDGYQYRWLDNSLQRFDTVPALGSGNEQAQGAYKLAIQTANKAPGTTMTQVNGIGDQATVITWDENKDNTNYHYATVVTRSANAVVTVDFNGAGLQGDTMPKADEMNQDAQQAAKEILTGLRR